MRRDDIVIDYAPVGIVTADLYLPTKIPLERMTLGDLARGMCPKSQRDLSVCRDQCKAPCRFGRELLRRCEDDE